MKMRKLLPLAVLGALAASNVHALNIDDFNCGSSHLTVDGSSANETSLGCAIGGSRDTTLTNVAGGSVLQSTNEASESSTGLFTLSNNFGATSDATVIWDNGGLGLGEDLTDGGTSDALLVKIIRIDQGGIDITFDISDGTNTSSRTLNNLGVGTFSFLFSSFSGSADFTNVSSIKMTVHTINDASDLALDFVETNQNCPNGTCNGVPEIDATAGTGAITLLGGMIALLADRRRRRA